MTFAEAKDQVAQIRGYSSWTKFFMDNYDNDVQGILNINNACDEAAELYAASVREEYNNCPKCGSTHWICQNCMLITH